MCLFKWRAVRDLHATDVRISRSFQFRTRNFIRSIHQATSIGDKEEEEENSLLLDVKRINNVLALCDYSVVEARVRDKHRSKSGQRA